jgi:short-subunit dehydrogenase
MGSTMSTFSNIFITGASSGIGQGLAQNYAQADVTLYLTGRDTDRLSQVAEACRHKGATVIEKVLDVCDVEQTEQFILEADQQTPLDLVIANAGVSASTGADEETAAHMRENFAVNVDGVLNTVLPIIEPMKLRGKGQIGVVSSVMGFRGLPNGASYSGSKAAVRVWGEGLRGSISQYGVGVSVIIPAMVKSRMTDALDFNKGAMSPDLSAQIIMKGLSKNKPRIGYSKGMYFMFWLLGCLPSFITDKVFHSRKKIGQNK